MIIIAILFTPIVVINIYRKYFSNIRLILIEGLDCSGKKTLAKAVLQNYQIQRKIRINVGPLFKSPLSKLSDILTYNWNLPNWLRSLVYTLSYIADCLFFIPKRNQVIIQVSYSPRHLAYNRIHQQGILNSLYNIFTPLHIRFYSAIYLYADYKARINRHRKYFKGKYEIQSIPERFLTLERDKYIDWEKKTFLESKKVAKYVKKIDTTNLTVEEIMQEINFEKFI